MTFPNVATKSRGVFLVTTSLLFSPLVFASVATVIVNVDNFVRAETASQFDRFLKAVLTYLGVHRADERAADIYFIHRLPLLGCSSRTRLPPKSAFAGFSRW